MDVKKPCIGEVWAIFKKFSRLSWIRLIYTIRSNWDIFDWLFLNRSVSFDRLHFKWHSRLKIGDNLVHVHVANFESVKALDKKKKTNPKIKNTSRLLPLKNFSISKICIICSQHFLAHNVWIWHKTTPIYWLLLLLSGKIPSKA